MDRPCALHPLATGNDATVPIDGEHQNEQGAHLTCDNGRPATLTGTGTRLCVVDSPAAPFSASRCGRGGCRCGKKEFGRTRRAWRRRCLRAVRFVHPERMESRWDSARVVRRGRSPPVSFYLRLGRGDHAAPTSRLVPPPRLRRLTPAWAWGCRRPVGYRRLPSRTRRRTSRRSRARA